MSTELAKWCAHVLQHSHPYPTSGTSRCYLGRTDSREKKMDLAFGERHRLISSAGHTILPHAFSTCHFQFCFISFPHGCGLCPWRFAPNLKRAGAFASTMTTVSVLHGFIPEPSLRLPPPLPPSCSCFLPPSTFLLYPPDDPPAHPFVLSGHCQPPWRGTRRRRGPCSTASSPKRPRRRATARPSAAAGLAVPSACRYVLVTGRGGQRGGGRGQARHGGGGLWGGVRMERGGQRAGDRGEVRGRGGYGVDGPEPASPIIRAPNWRGVAPVEAAAWGVARRRAATAARRWSAAVAELVWR